jgi:hypothetical protein
VARVLVDVDNEERPGAAVAAVLLLHLLRRRAAALAVVAASEVAPACTQVGVRNTIRQSNTCG